LIAIIDYRTGNQASVKNALEHLGAECVITSDPARVKAASKVVLPGVGHFSETRTLDEVGLRPVIQDAVASGKPFLGICVGMQWLFAGSTESPQVKGLGLFAGECSRFSSDVKSPHVGWNTLIRRGKSRLLSGLDDQAFAYFTHSYRAPVAPECVATTTYDNAFASVVERDNVFGVQFHPEKSAEAGLRILRNFVELQ
jgi:imidazole glycerol-phosphate synthase subunit HisH